MYGVVTTCLLSGYNVMYPGSAEVALEWLATLSEDVVVAFDPSNRVMDIPQENLVRVLERADWTLCNESEASLLTGEESLDDSVATLAQRTVEPESSCVTARAVARC